MANSAPIQAPSPFWARHVHADRRPFLAARARILQAWRSWFAGQDFIEVETSILQVSPGNEAHISAFGTEFLGPDGRKQPFYLHSSPEFACKKLLAAGEERIFTLARVFRNRERGPLHAPEFTMLEWYRADAPYHQLIGDCRALAAEAARAAGTKMFHWKGRACDPFAAPEVISVTEAFGRHAGIDLEATLGPSGAERDGLAAQAVAKGIRVTDDDSWADIFSKVLSEKIEPRLGIGCMSVLDLYPVSEAALARPSLADPRFAERFELYACGVELANAFGELTDPAEQKRRFEAEMAERQRIYGESYPIDADFLAALTHMPAASGIALGAERLIMLAAGAQDIDQVIWTPAAAALNAQAATLCLKPVRKWIRHNSMADDSRFDISQTLRSAGELAAAGLIAPAQIAPLAAVGAAYAIAITPDIAALIDPADAADPIARQFVPDTRELDHASHELADPIGDAAHSPAPGIVHRYPDRVLLKLLSVCPVYCRFCFRREMVGPGADQVLSPEALDAAIAYIAATPAIWEVILTGGDPLMLSPRRLAMVLQSLDAIAHVKVVRIHTRVPVVDSARIGDELIAALKSSRKTVYVALHANHPREMSEAARAACARLVDAGIPMVSQSVLLRGVNDNADTLAQLMRLFVENRIKPYYLHHGDLAPGTAHFRTGIEEGRALMRQLRGRLSGIAMPEYVLDIPGGHGKSPIGPAFADSAGQRIEDWQGGHHDYVDPPANGSSPLSKPNGD